MFSISGAADIFDEFVYDDDDYDGSGVEYPHGLPDIFSWADSVLSSPASNSYEHTSYNTLKPKPHHTLSVYCLVSFFFCFCHCAYCDSAESTYISERRTKPIGLVS